MADTTVYNQYNMRYNIDLNDGDINNDDDMCDPVGYEPFEQQIYDIFYAGQQLNNYMRQTYPNGIPEEEIDEVEPLPYGMDVMDAMDMQKAVSASLEAQYNAYMAAQSAAQPAPAQPSAAPAAEDTSTT